MICYQKIFINKFIYSGNIENAFVKEPNNYSNKKQAFPVFNNGVYKFYTLTGYEFNLKAENIDSDIVADTVFNLRNQIKGIASGSMHVETRNKLKYIKHIS